jgi:hypothetical protein
VEGKKSVPRTMLPWSAWVRSWDREIWKQGIRPEWF